MNYTCNNCGWVAFGVTRKHAEQEVNRFNEYFETLSKRQQTELYGGKGASIKQYEACLLCSGGYENFRLSMPNDCPEGCTLNPIIIPNSNTE